MASYTAEDVIKIAQDEIGYMEKASNSQLDSKTANAGSANYTKYARDLYNAGYYNGNKQGCEWCDMFYDWCHYQAAGKDKNLAQSVECQTGDCGAGCSFSKQYYQAAGCLSKTPQPGDQVFFLVNGSVDHTGMVETVSSTQVTTIEGNSNNQVRRRTYSIGDSSIDSYGHPKFGTSSSSSSSSNSSSSSSSTSSSGSTSSLSAGSAVTLSNVKLYSSSSATSSSGTVSGTYYIWSSEQVNSRIRITNKSSNVGVSSQVTGWVNVSDISVTSSSSSSSSTSSSTSTSTSGLEAYEMAQTYKNGSTVEPVYADTNLSNKIGSLNAYETCDCIGKANGKYIVRYQVDNTSNYKVGFVAYSGGVS